MIEKLSVQFSIKECCLALSVSRSGYYRWAADEPSLGVKADTELVKQIQRLVLRPVRLLMHVLPGSQSTTIRGIGLGSVHKSGYTR